MIKLEHLRHFVEVVRVGNLNDAAKNLHRTQSAISTTLKILEQEIGSPLFTGERKNELTPVGCFVAKQAQSILEEYNLRIEAIRLYVSGNRGQIRIAAVPSIAKLLPEILENFYQLNLKIKIELHDCSSTEVIKSVRSMEVDFGIGSLGDESIDIDTQLLCSDPFVCVFPSNHLLAKETEKLSWKRLAKYDFVSNQLCHQIDAPEFNPILKQARLKVHNTTSLFAFIEKGYGVTLLPYMSYLLAPNLHYIGLEDRKAVRKILLIQKSNKTLSPATIQVITLLSDYLKSTIKI